MSRAGVRVAFFRLVTALDEDDAFFLPMTGRTSVLHCEMRRLI